MEIKTIHSQSIHEPVLLPIKGPWLDSDLNCSGGLKPEVEHLS